MPLTREQKIELIRKKQAGTLTREDKITILRERGVTAPKKEDSWLKTKIPGTDAEIGETVIRPGLQALGAVGGGIVGTVGATPGVGTAVGAGLGYAGAEELYKLIGGRESEGVKDFATAGKNVLEGAAMEAGGAVLPGVISAIRKTPGLVKEGVSKLLNKPTKVGVEVAPMDVKSGKDVLREVSNLKTTPEMQAANERFKGMGLEELTPAQLQPKIKGEPTPAQTAEAMLKARDQDLYNQGMKQMSSAETLLERYRQLGAPTPEAAGQQIKGLIKGKKEVVGKEIGKFKQAGKDIAVKKDKGFPLSKDDVFALSEDFGRVKGIQNLYKQAKTVSQLDDLSSNIGSQIAEANRAGNSKLHRKLKDVKTFLEEQIAKNIEDAGIEKPKEAYQTYTEISKIADDTMRGLEQTGRSKDVINKITATGENIDQFRQLANTLKAPELMTTVKENWLSNLFNDVRYASRWEKVKKDGTAAKLLDQKQIAEIDSILDYMDKAKSTLTKTVNPPRSGVVQTFEKLADKPAKTIVSMVFGDEAKYARAIRRYKAIQKAKPGSESGGLKDSSLRRSLVTEIGREED